MDKTTLNTQLVTTGLKRVFYHLTSNMLNAKDQIWWKVLVWLPMKRMSGLILLLVRLVFRRYE